MAGVKGRSGGARAGAGRPRNENGEEELIPPAPPAAETPVEFLLGVMNDLEQDPRLRVRAAIAAAQYVHTKKHDGGKKEEQGDAAKKAATGRFAPAQPPRLVVSR